MDGMRRYRLFKMLHITGLILWLGPSSGVFYLIIKSALSEEHIIELWLREAYMDMIYLEVFALAFIILTGIGMIVSSKKQLLGAGWLRLKLLIVGMVFVPVEALQFYIYRFYLLPSIHTDKGLTYAISMIDNFNIIAWIILSITLPIVFFLAIFKPGGKGM